MAPSEFRALTLDTPIVTERLSLRTVRPTDVDDMFAYQSREDVCLYLLYEARTREQIADRVAVHSQAIEIAKDGDYWQLAVEIPATADVPARVIGDLYFSVKSVENANAEIGWTFNPDFHNLGYAREAADAVMRVGFERMGLHRIAADLDPRNEASIRLCKRLGMREEAYHVKDLAFRGGWADTGIYAILEAEWAALHAR